MSTTSSSVIFSLIVCMAFGGCAGRASMAEQTNPIPGKDYLFSYVDLPQEGRFKLTLVSKSSRDLCTGKSRWPTEAGYMENASGTTFVVLGEKRYSYKNFDMDVCPYRACGNPMTRGMRLESSLLYRDFDLPQSSYGLSKELGYDPRPFWCDEGRWIDVRSGK